MIPANRQTWFTSWFAWVTRKRIRDSFAAIRASGLHRLAEAAKQGPVIAVANHSSWWDGLIALHLCHNRLGLETFAMMDKDSLLGAPFFTLVGGFGVDRSHRRDGAKALRYAAGLLDRPGRVLWVFPQGEQLPAHQPLRFFPGAARLAQLATNASVIPVGIHYAFGQGPRPHCMVSVADPLEPVVSRADAVDDQQAGVEHMLTRCKQCLDGDDQDFEMLEQAPTDHVDRWMTWGLGAFARLWLRDPRRQLELPVSTHP